MEDFKEVDIDEAKKLMSQDDVIIVDVRSEEAFEEGHIDNAVSVNDSNIEEFVNKTDKARPVLCYCYMGFSSKGAAQYLKDQGFEQVYSMTGGYTAWQEEHEDSENK